jgi:hypothetical protein
LALSFDHHHFLCVQEMTPETKKKATELRHRINARVLDDLERMLNASKGAGTTTALIDQAKRLNIPLIVHSNAWAENLIAENAGLRAKHFSSHIGGEKVLIDNGVNWLLLKEAQALRKMSEDLLNRLEQEKILRTNEEYDQR